MEYIAHAGQIEHVKWRAHVNVVLGKEGLNGLTLLEGHVLVTVCRAGGCRGNCVVQGGVGKTSEVVCVSVELHNMSSLHNVTGLASAMLRIALMEVVTPQKGGVPWLIVPPVQEHHHAYHLDTLQVWRCGMTSSILRRTLRSQEVAFCRMGYTCVLEGGPKG